MNSHRDAAALGQALFEPVEAVVTDAQPASTALSTFEERGQAAWEEYLRTSVSVASADVKVNQGRLLQADRPQARHQLDLPGRTLIAAYIASRSSYSSHDRTRCVRKRIQASPQKRLQTTRSLGHPAGRRRKQPGLLGNQRERLASPGDAGVDQFAGKHWSIFIRQHEHHMIEL